MTSALAPSGTTSCPCGDVEGPGAEGLLHRPPDIVEVDAERPQCVRIQVDVGSGRLLVAGPAESVGRDASITEDFAGDPRVVREGDDHVLGADSVVTSVDGLVPSPDDRATGGGREALEHGQFLPGMVSRGPCF